MAGFRKSRSIMDRFEKHAERTFAEAAARYLAELQAKDKGRIARLIESTFPYIGHMRVIDVDDESMQQFKEDRRLGRPPFNRPAMMGTINKELTQVVTILNKACRVWRWIPSAAKLEYVKGARRQPYPLSWEEQDRLFRCLPTGWDVGVALFAVNTGCRKSEIFNLKWTDLRRMPEIGPDIIVGIVRESKNGHQRAIIMNSYARKAVEYQRKAQAKLGQSEWVFPSMAGNNRFGRSRGGNVWQQAWKLAGLPSDPMIRKGMHNARHTFAHRLRAAGVPAEDRNALLGHANTDLSTHYAQPDIERLLAHAEKVCERRATTVLRAVG